MRLVYNPSIDNPAPFYLGVLLGNAGNLVIDTKRSEFVVNSTAQVNSLGLPLHRSPKSKIVEIASIQTNLDGSIELVGENRIGASSSTTTYPRIAISQ